MTIVKGNMGGLKRREVIQWREPLKQPERGNVEDFLGLSQCLSWVLNRNRHAGQSGTGEGEFQANIEAWKQGPGTSSESGTGWSEELGGAGGRAWVGAGSEEDQGVVLRVRDWVGWGLVGVSWSSEQERRGGAETLVKARGTRVRSLAKANHLHNSHRYQMTSRIRMNEFWKGNSESGL